MNSGSKNAQVRGVAGAHQGGDQRADRGGAQNEWVAARQGRSEAHFRRKGRDRWVAAETHHHLLQHRHAGQCSFLYLF